MTSKANRWNSMISYVRWRLVIILSEFSDHEALLDLDDDAGRIVHKLQTIQLCGGNR